MVLRMCSCLILDIAFSTFRMLMLYSINSLLYSLFVLHLHISSLSCNTAKGYKKYQNDELIYYGNGSSKRLNWNGMVLSPRTFNGALSYEVVRTSRPAEPGQVGLVASQTPQSNPYFFGTGFITRSDLGIQISTGLNVKLIARTGQRVQYSNGGVSSLRFHSQADAAGIIPLSAGGYVYVSNSELRQGQGGVFGLYFNNDGKITEYKALLTGTSGNCGGGLTPWKTWVSCEENGSSGQCWQIDPVQSKVQRTVLGGNGGNYESVAVDKRIRNRPVFFTTEDEEDGALRRFTAQSFGFDALHSKGGTTFLYLLDNGTFKWTINESLGRNSARRHFPYAEGIQVHEGKVYFMAKKIRTLITLDLDSMTYVKEITGKKFYGEGSFGSQPDQTMIGPSRKYLYFTEDGGSTPGVYGRHSDGTYFTMFQAIDNGMHDGDETTGIALSPDHTRFYAAFQDSGLIFEFTRKDKLPFE